MEFQKRSIVILKSRLFFKGGLEKYTLKLATHFASLGHEVVILTTSPIVPSSSYPFQIISLGKSSKFSLYHLWHFDRLCQKWLKKHKADIVFGMERNRHQSHYRAGSGVHAAFLKRRFEVESFCKKLSLVFNPLHYFLLYLEKKAFEHPQLKVLFVNSQMVKKEILTYYAVPEKKIEVIHNGVAWKEFEQPFREQKKSQKFEFLFIGNGYRRKGLLFLLMGLAALKNASFHLNVVGKDKNMIFFQKKVSELGLKENVTFYGVQENIIPFYQKSDVLVLPTLYDPFANVTLEALSMGLFVITSEYNGAKEILTKETGIVIKNLYDSNAIKKALEIGLSHPKTDTSARNIRNSVKDLEFSNQLDKIVQKSIQSI